jgi:hypothetical protein
MKKHSFLFALFFALLFLFSQKMQGQNYYRLRVDITVKKRYHDGKFSLVKGTVYYDNTTGKMVTDIWFPEKEQYVMLGKMVYVIKNGKLISASENPMPPETTIFALVLKNSIQYYGLENSDFKLSDVQEDGDLVISTWLPPDNLKTVIGKILIANKNGLITGIIFYNAEGKIVSKQFFEEYRNINGIMFPTRMIQFFYDEQGNETIQKTEFKNIVIDEKDHDNFYDFPISAYLKP